MVMLGSVLKDEVSSNKNGIQIECKTLIVFTLQFLKEYVGKTEMVCLKIT